MVCGAKGNEIFEGISSSLTHGDFMVDFNPAGLVAAGFTSTVIRA